MLNSRDTFLKEAYSCILAEDDVLIGRGFVNVIGEILFNCQLNMLNG